MIGRERQRAMDLAASDLLPQKRGFYIDDVVANLFFLLVPPLSATEGPPMSSRMSIRSRISRQNSHPEQPGRPSTAL
jgi:hypothetical protein